MIPNYHFYDGAALSFITARGEFTALTRIGDLAGRAYALNHDRRIYIKHATNDMSPWLSDTNTPTMKKTRARNFAQNHFVDTPATRGLHRGTSGCNPFNG